MIVFISECMSVKGECIWRLYWKWFPWLFRKWFLLRFPWLNKVLFCTKLAFHDALVLRCGWPLSRTPSHGACGTSFTVDRALSCPKGGLPTLRHNEIRDLTATLLTEVCHQIHVEPEVQPVSSPETFPLSTESTQDGARLELQWIDSGEAVRNDATLMWEFLILTPHSFTPIILSVTGGMAQKATMFYKRLASLLATKWNDYGKVMGWLRCCLSFSLLRPAIACVRGARSSIGHVYRAPPSLDVICVESHLNINDQ